MAKDFEWMEDSNLSPNPDIHSVSDPARRVWDSGGIGALLGGALAPLFAGCAVTPRTGPLLGFKAVPTSTSDAVIVPEGYIATAIAAWGEPVGIPGHCPPGATTPPTARPNRRRRWACTTTACTSTRWRAAVRAACWPPTTSTPTTACSSAGRTTATSTAPRCAGTTSCSPMTRPTPAPKPGAMSMATFSVALED